MLVEEASLDAVAQGFSTSISVDQLRLYSSTVTSRPCLCSTSITAGNLRLSYSITVGSVLLQLCKAILGALANLQQLFFGQQRFDIPHQTTAMYVFGFDDLEFLLQGDEVCVVTTKAVEAVNDDWATQAFRHG
ncbi:hypothetical protein D9M71_715880 [compost metagenome]